jgi:hypothetical protein
MELPSRYEILTPQQAANLLSVDLGVEANLAYLLPIGSGS